MSSESIFPPGPPPARHLVELFSLIRELERDVLGVMGQRFATYGDVFYGKILDRNVYHACHPDAIHEVLVGQARAFGKRTTDLEVLGHGLLTSDGEHWRRQRRRIQPAFRHDSVLGYGSLISEETERLIARLKARRIFDVRSEMLALTLRVVCRALFGQHFSGNGKRIARAVRVLQEGVARPKLLPAWLPTPRRLLNQRMRAAIDDEVFSIIDKGSSAPGSLLAELRAISDDGGNMSRTELRDEVVTLFLAGHETTALALTWAFHLLSYRPAMADRIAAETTRVAGQKAIGAEHFAGLELTLRVLKEAMRLYPPVYVIPRIAQEQVTLGGYQVPAGSELWLWVYFMQRDPRWYRLPDRFDPDRFLADGEIVQHPRAYAPFGQGTRTCIGRDFALLEAVIVLGSLLRRFRFTLVDSRPLWPLPRVTLAPARPLKLRLEARD